jgi:cholesterol transport system auxiliary component
MSRLTRRFALVALATTPAGCSGLLSSSAPPPKLYTLTPATDFPANASHVAWQLLVDVPVSTAALDADRIALSGSPTSIDYFADAAWIDRAPLLVQSLIVQSFENSGRIGAVARESLALRGDFMLQSELRHFEADYGAGATPTAHVQIAVKLVRLPDRTITAQHAFDATAPAKENQVPAIVDAFNNAFHQASQQIVEWTIVAAR